MAVDKCLCIGTSVVNTRVNTSAGRYDGIPNGIRMRKRRCKECRDTFTTYEGTLKDLVYGFSVEIKILLSEMDHDKG